MADQASAAPDGTEPSTRDSPNHRETGQDVNPDLQDSTSDLQNATSDLQNATSDLQNATSGLKDKSGEQEDSPFQKDVPEESMTSRPETRENETPQPPQSTSDESDYDAVLSVKKMEQEEGESEDKGELLNMEGTDDGKDGEVFTEEPEQDTHQADTAGDLHNGDAHKVGGDSASQDEDREEKTTRALDSDRLNDDTLGVIQDTDSVSSGGSLGADMASEAALDAAAEDVAKDAEDKTVTGSLASVSAGGRGERRGVRDTPSSKARGSALKKGEPARVGTFSATSRNTETSEGTRLVTLRGKTNTPSSFFTDVTAEIKNIKNRQLESREAVFQRAMTLMSTRCTSNTQMMEPLFSDKDEPYGVHIPQYFYIQQRKPSPGPPVKAWHGYNGNVYFEPLHISGLSGGSSSTGAEQPCSESRAEHIRKLIRPRKPSARIGQVSQSTTRQSGTTIRTWPAAPALVVLDRNVVLNQQNNNLEEDMLMLQSQESTGSLTTRPHPPATPTTRHPPRRSAPPSRGRIFRGSMAHKSKSAKQRKGPTLGVAGDKFASPTLTSPLLRTQTQYSLSSQRAAMNSPDVVHHGHFEHLPPLEQVRASLRHMDGDKGRAGSYSRSVTVTDSPKPFIKYSPDFRLRYNQAPYC